MNENTGSKPPAGGGWLRLAVKNFGPIAEGEVELRPLTVFTGPGNTGKSWLATLIYALARHAKGDSIDPDDNRLEDFPEDPAAWLESLEEYGVVPLTDGEQQTLKSFLESRQEVLKEELLRCFGLAEARHLVREGETGTARVTFMNAAPLATRDRLMIGGKEGFSHSVDVMTDAYRPPSPEFFMDALAGPENELDDEPDEDFPRDQRAELFGLLIGSRRQPRPHYLPADRGAVLRAHRVAVGAPIQSASSTGLNRNPSQPMLPGVLADFLERTVPLTGREPGQMSTSGDLFSDPVGSLERNVLGGEIRAESSPAVDNPHFTYRPDGWTRDLSLMGVSSMVSELAPVAHYLHHYVYPGDLLILEEPEAHLHPETQVRLVREIAGWVRQGIRVLITTHSEWMLEAIANMVAEAEAGKAGSLLRRRDVGVWRFDKNTPSETKGSRIREVEWDPDEGGFPVGFGAVAGNLMNTWADLLEKTE